MGHSADYQTELHIRELEQVAHILMEEGLKLKEAGYEGLANAAFDQAEQLKRALITLRLQISKLL
jgi:hypothetical protein